MPEEKPGFEINGEHFDLPRLDDVTLDEERILYLYADTVLSDFAPAHPDAPLEEKREIAVDQWRKVRNPDFKRALAHIAYRRRYPDVEDAEIRSAIGHVRALEVDVALQHHYDDRPPEASPKPPDEPRSTPTQSRLEDSGRPTESGSAKADATPPSIGITESGTYSPQSLETTSAS